MFFHPRYKKWQRQNPRRCILPLDEIGSRYVAGETLKDILCEYPKLPYAKPEEVVRRQLLRRGVRKQWRAPLGKRNRFWKGKQYKSPMHFYRRQSYEVAAICQGKPLEPGEVIHHIDENPEHNAPENLMIFPNNDQHARYHQQLLKHQREGLEVDAIRLALENGARALQRPACLSAWKPDINPPVILGTKGRRIGRPPCRHATQQ